MKISAKSTLAILLPLITAITLTAEDAKSFEQTENISPVEEFQEITINYEKIISDFLENPFIQIENFPTYFNYEEEFTNYFSDPKYKIQEASNNRVLVEAENVFLHYIKNTNNSKLFLKTTEITSIDSNVLKHEIHLGMKKDEIINIFGKKFWTNKYTRNYEICYEGNGIRTSDQLSFLFDYNDNLINILIHGYVD